jgi:multiple sugar transport system permease protein
MNANDRGIMSRHDFSKKSTKMIYSFIVLIIGVMVYSMLYPVATIFMNALKKNPELFAFPPKFLPSEWMWENFSKSWSYIELPIFMKNTLFIFFGNMLSIMIITGLAAYSLSKLKVPYKRWISLFFLTTLLIPPTTYIIPNFINLKELGLLNSFWAFWLPAGANAFYLLLLKSFFDGLNNELFEAARIDGASELRCYFQIAFPLSVPIFATLSIFVFATAWNDWFWPSLVMHSDDKYPLATAIYKYVIQVRRLDWNLRFAILSMISVPPIVVFLLFQKYIMRGLHLSGVKG